jgi:3-polyprenyl-4-hydroxybenzoate decarboxylase
LWSYGETGFHSLAAAVVRERYTREALVAGFRILGEGQLALTKFLILTDSLIDLHDFPRVLEHVLARVNWQTDFFIFSNTSMDTLDYTSGKVNEGSKAILMGLGDAVRELPGEFSGELPQGIKRAEVFCAGCLVVEGSPYLDEPEQGARLAGDRVFSGWPLVILLDDAGVAYSTTDFLWSTWTRFEPAGDIYAAETKVVRHHLAYHGPIIIDARKKPSLPDELVVRDDIAKLVDRRWREYFPSGL